ncbi:MAG: hypothetical protein Q9227_003359 [Pyrenula ochraceoflavens]
MCMNDYLYGVTRPGIIRNTKKDMKLDDYLTAVQKNEAQERDLLISDLQDDIAKFDPYFDKLGSCPAALSGRDLEKRVTYGPRQVDGRQLALRVVCWKFGQAYITNFSNNLAGGLVTGQDWTTSARSAAFSALGVSLVQVFNGIIDQLKTEEKLPAVLYVLWRLLVGQIAKLIAALGRAAFGNCVDWDAVATWAPYAVPVLNAPVPPRNMALEEAFQQGVLRGIELMEQGNPFGNNWGHIQGGSGGGDIRKRSADDDDVIEFRRGNSKVAPNDGASIVLGGEDDWENAVAAKPRTCDKGAKTLSDVLEDAGIKGYDPVSVPF